MASYSLGEREFIDFATNSTNSASDVSTFNTKITALRNGLMTPNFYPWLNYSTDRITMLNNWLTYYQEYVGQWPENLDTFNPYNAPIGPFPAPNERTSGQCRGFWKKMCIAKWTALFAIAGSGANLGAGTVIGAAAGYLIGRCCKCCSCDGVSCAL